MSVGILMATYNGEKYIEEQIKSIVEQTHKDWELWIRDDNSFDMTLEIINRIAHKDKRIRLISSQSKNLGVIDNFSILLSIVNKHNYYLTCDQDDVWDVNKIEIMLKEIISLEEKYGSETPIAIFSDLRLINSDGKVTSNSFYDSREIECSLKVFAFENYAIGCTMIFNKALKGISIPFPEGIIMHDWWISLKALTSGHLSYLPKQLVSYRQHQDNVVGASQRNLRKSFFKWKYFYNQIQIRSKQINILKESLRTNQDLLTHTYINELHNTVNVGGLWAVGWLIQNKIVLSTKLRTIGFYSVILLQPIIKLIHTKSTARHN